MGCFSHSSAQALHMSAHNLQASWAKALSMLISVTAASHIAAHSRSVRMQVAIAVTSFSRRQEEAQCLQAAIQSMQASMQL
jgi:hypothetical protein